ncbi:MAG: T9SS type A sorting domain-containing protein [Tannerella sp.]|nr:T9SS type A sorting domain-containing protein [Tannerella sp.]
MVLLAACGISLKGQDCGTTGISSFEITEEMYKEYGTMNRLTQTYCINVFIHVVRDNNGSGGLNPNQINNIIVNLNWYFNSHGIYFTNSGYEFINATDYLILDSESEALLLMQKNVHSNAINIYTVDSLYKKDGQRLGGKAFDIPSNRLVIRKELALMETAAHEVGHCLNLMHTHETAYCVEALNGSNCSSCGDKVCDTPADPYPETKAGYNPDKTNLMSYYPVVRDHFTAGQVERMKVSIDNSLQLQEMLSTACAYPEPAPVITGPSSVCPGSTATFTVSNAPTGFTWGHFKNLTPVSISGNSGTFQATSPAGPSWVSINVGSTEVVRKNLFAGNTLSITGPDIIANNASGSYFPEFSCSPASGTFYWTLSQSGSPALPQTGKTFSSTQSLVIKATPGPAAYTYVLEVAFGITTVTKYIGINGGTLTMVAMIEQKLSPNPASSEVTVDVIDNSTDPAGRSAKVYTVQIVDMSGRAVYQEKNQGGKFNISTSSFPNGIYKVIVSDGENTAQETLIIKH